MSKRTNALNPGLAFSNVDNAYTAGIMATRYDINMGGMMDNDNPAVLLVDSRDRNHDVYPQPSEYVIKLDPPYKEVVSVELVMADIPNSGYVIDESHNLIHFQDTDAMAATGNYITAEIPIGNRTIDDICDKIEEQMTAASAISGGGYTYTCTVNEHTNLVTIAQDPPSSQAFNLLFAGIPEKTDPPSYRKNGVYTGKYRSMYRERSIGKVIGFLRSDYTGAHTYTGTYTYDLKPYKYIALFINNNLSNGSFNRVDAPNSKVKDAFCIIPLDSESSNFEYAKNFDSCENAKFIKYFTEPVPEINELNLRFADADGNLFNFTGRDHTLLFEIRSNTRRGMFTESSMKKREK